MSKILSIIFILNFIIIGTVSAAEQNMRRNFNSNKKMNSDEMDTKIFKEMDTNNNGCVSFKEFQAHSKKMMQNRNRMQKPSDMTQ